MALNLQNLTPFKPGNPGGPGRAPSAGSTIREWINQLTLSDLTEQQLSDIANDRTLQATKRMAANRILACLERGDLADFEPWLKGEKSLDDLRKEGLNTAVVKKSKIGEKGGREIELHDRAGTEVDRIIGHTELSIGDAEKYARVDDGKATERWLIKDDLTGGK